MEKIEIIFSMINRSPINKFYIHAETEDELVEAYTLLNDCGLGVKNVKKYAKEKFNLFKELTGLLVNDEGVRVVELNDIYSDYVFSVGSFKSRLNKNNVSVTDTQLTLF